MDVDVVDDELAVGVRVKRCADDAGTALVQARHGVEEMRDVLGAVLLDGLACRSVVGRRVAERDDDAVRVAVGDELAAIMQLFRRDGDDLDDVLIRRNLREICLGDVLLGLCALLGRADERPFHMAAEHAGAFLARHGLAHMAEGTA